MAMKFPIDERRDVASAGGLRGDTAGLMQKSALRVLARLATAAAGASIAKGAPQPEGMSDLADAVEADVEVLFAADLVSRSRDGTVAITDAGRAYLARMECARKGSAIDPFLGQHLTLAHGEIETDGGRAGITIDAGESPLAWLVRRKGRDGRALIEPAQFQAGERLRADFTRAQLMPRITANWTSAIAQGRRGGGGMTTFAEAVVAARQRVRRALAVVGPEFTGLLLDVCCFLKRLEDVERERRWPPRSAKVVLQLGLDRLARHYGYGAVAQGAPHAAVRTWLAEDAVFATAE
jgi:hypothetical protein